MMNKQNSVSDVMLMERRLAFDEGVKYALNYLREVYGEGLEETDLWDEYIKEDR